MPEVSVEIEVFCHCGEGLCGQSTGGTGSFEMNTPTITLVNGICLNCGKKGFVIRDNGICIKCAGRLAIKRIKKERR